MNPHILCLLAFWLATNSPTFGQFIWIDLSFKAVLNPISAARSYSFSETNLDAAIATANDSLAKYERGYRFRRVSPIIDIGGNGTNGPSKWFFVNPRGTNLTTGDWDNRKQMEIEAMGDPLTYAWNSNAINYYITAGFGAPADAGECAFPSGNNHLIVLGTVDNGPLLLHETGHYFELYHTQGGCVGCGNLTNCFQTNGWWVGDDGISDTLPTAGGDFCFTNQNFLSLANFNLTYSNCSAVQKQQVDDAFYNLMAYGFDRTLDRLTPQQLDKWTDISHDFRTNVLSGRTRFVSPTGNNGNTGLYSTMPKLTVSKAVTASSAAGGDIVLLRPGNYNEQLTITRPVTLRSGATNSFPGFPRTVTVGAP